MRKNITALIAFFFALTAQSELSWRDNLQNNFTNLPENTKPGLYWYWMNEHVSKSGITKDLEAMVSVGIGEAFIGNIYEGGVPGKVATLSDEWLDCMRHAIKEGSRLGIKISLFNSPGWSQSGGPWVMPDKAMRYISSDEVIIEGGKRQTIKFKDKGSYFQQVAVLAVPFAEENPKIASCKIIPERTENQDNLWDKNDATVTTFNNSAHGTISIEIFCKESFDAQSLEIYPTGMGFNTTCELYAWIDGKFKKVSSEFFDRSNTSLQLGPLPDGKLAMSFNSTKSDRFKIVMNDLPEKFKLKKINLTNQPKVEKVTEKSLQKLPNTSNPQWNSYRWETAASRANDKAYSANEVINITTLCTDGVMQWEAPKGGKWKIIRLGMLPTYTTNTPAAPIAKGLEIDKLSKAPIEKHFQSYIGKVISGLTVDERKSLNRTIVDSYEVGPQNWSDNYREEFMKRTGYDPIPYLPVLTGDVVDSREISDRFLWDIRRVVADLIAENYVGGLRDISHKNGMTLWLENYGHWGFPAEFLLYGKYSDEIGGEFWAGGTPGKECRLAASASHIYGKNQVYAESFTAGGNNFKWTPAKLKRLGDWSYTEGVNKNNFTCVYSSTL